VDQRGTPFLYVAETEAGEIVGFVSAGLEHEDDSDYRGEVYAIYSSKKAQG
jgi:hypothetical protein